MLHMLLQALKRDVHSWFMNAYITHNSGFNLLFIYNLILGRNMKYVTCNHTKIYVSENTYRRIRHSPVC